MRSSAGSRRLSTAADDARRQRTADFHHGTSAKEVRLRLEGPATGLSHAGDVNNGRKGGAKARGQSVYGETIKRKRKEKGGNNRSRIDAEGTTIAESVHDIHDAFFKAIMRLPGKARLFLQEHLPAPLAELLGEGPLEILPGSFVKKTLHQTHTDLLLMAPLKDGSPLLVHFVLEHKSRPDRFAPLQLAQYVVDVLQRWHEKHPGTELPAVVSVLVHNGPTPWNFSTQLADLTGPVPLTIREHMLSLKHVLVDLQTIDDNDLSRSPDLRTILRALKHGTNPDYLRSRAEEFVVLGMCVRPLVARPYFLSYIGNVIDFDKLEAILKRVAPDVAQEFMELAMQPVFAKGKAEGKAEGEAEGLVQAVLAVVQERFSLEPVPEVLRGHIATASAATLLTLHKRLLTAASLEEVFGDGLDGYVRGGLRVMERPTTYRVSQSLAWVVLRVAAKRFAPVPDGVRKLIVSSSEAMLELWLDQLIDAGSLEEVFGGREERVDGDNADDSVKPFKKDAAWAAD